MVDNCAYRASPRSAWCVAEELLIAHIRNATQEREEAEATLKEMQGLGDEVGAASALRRIVKAAKAHALDLKYGPDSGGSVLGQSYLDEVEGQLTTELEKVTSEGARLQLLLAQAELNNHHCQYNFRTEALDSALKAVDIAVELDDPVGEAEGLYLAALCLSDYQSERALSYAEEAAPIFCRLGNTLWEGMTWHLKGVCRLRTKLRKRGFMAMDQALQIFRKCGAPVYEALELFTIAELHVDWRWFRRGDSAASQAVEKFGQLGYGRGWLANAYRVKVVALTGRELCARAQQLGFEAVEDFRDRGDLKAAADVQIGLVESLEHEQRHDNALQVAEELLQQANSFDDPDFKGSALLALGRLHIHNDEMDQAKVVLDEACNLAKGQMDDVSEWIIRWVMIRMYENYPTPTEAVKQLDEQQKLNMSMGDRVREGWTLLRYCLVWGSADEATKETNEKALRAATKAQKIFEEFGDRGAEASAWDKMAQANIISVDDKKMDPEEALRCAERGRQLHRERGNKEWEAKMLHRVFCRIYTEWGRHAKATEAGEEAVSIARQCGDKMLLADILSQQVWLRMEQVLGEDGDEGPPALSGKEAARACRHALKQSREAYNLAKQEGEDRAFIGWCAHQYGMVLIRMDGNLNSALEHAVKAKDLGEECHELRLQAHARLLESEVYTALGDHKAAAQTARRALENAQASRDEEAMAAALQRLEWMEQDLEVGASRGRQDQRIRGEYQGQTPHGIGHVDIGGKTQADHKPGKLRGSRVDKESLMKIVAETALTNSGLGNVNFDTPLVEAGMDSLTGVALRNELQSLTAMHLSSSILHDHPTQRSLISHLVQRSDLEFTDA